jgi:hypothetical protein
MFVLALQMVVSEVTMNLHLDSTILDLAGTTKGAKFRTILADPPWRFTNRTGKVAPEPL